MKAIGKLILLLTFLLGACESPVTRNLTELFQNPPQETNALVNWYWMNGGVSAEGIASDLEAMKANGTDGLTSFYSGQMIRQISLELPINFHRIDGKWLYIHLLRRNVLE